MTVFYICMEWLVTFIEVTICNYFMHVLFPDRFQKKKQRVLCFFVIAVITTGIILFNLVELSFSIETVLYFLVAAALGGCVLYKGRFFDFFFTATGYMAFMNIIDGTILNILAQFGFTELIVEVQQEFSIHRIYLITLLKGTDVLLAMPMGLLLGKIKSKLKKTRIVLAGAGISLVLTYCLMNVSHMPIDLGLKPVQTVLMIGIIFLFSFFYLMYRFRSLQREKEFAFRQNDLLKKSYEMAQEAYESNAKLYHDMRNHFTLLQSYIADGKIPEAQSYLETLNGKKTGGNVERLTGIEAIDYILGQKISVAEKEQITVTANVEYPKDCAIDPVDLCTILTNLTDNAIESDVKMEDIDQRNIDITIRRIHQFILIRISNSSATPPVLHRGQLITTKEENGQHGWGMQSVRSAAEKYNGTIAYRYENSTFTVSVMLCY